jgi:hypothetical protein
MRAGARPMLKRTTLQHTWPKDLIEVIIYGQAAA